MTKAQTIIDKTINRLRDEESFEDWWGNLTDSARDSIEEDLVKIVDKLVEDK